LLEHHCGDFWLNADQGIIFSKWHMIKRRARLTGETGGGV